MIEEHGKRISESGCSLDQNYENAAGSIRRSDKDLAYLMGDPTIYSTYSKKQK